MNAQKLKGKILEMERNYEDCANALGISRSAFYKKISGRNKFYIDEADKLGDFLNMTDEEKTLTFLR